ncbi:MAG: hypothetical protein AB1798_04600 [Spirochaetota bacterium]
MKSNKTIIFLLFMITLSACSSFRKTNLETYLISNNGSGPLQKVVLLNTVKAEGKTLRNRIESEVRAIVPGLAQRAGVRLIKDTRASEAQFLVLDIILSEKDFTRNLDTLNSISAVLKFSGTQKGEDILTIIYTEESAETLESHYYLHAILKKLFKEYTQFRKYLEKGNRKK